MESEEKQMARKRDIPNCSRTERPGDETGDRICEALHQAPNQPLRVFRSGTVSALVWQEQDGSGKKRLYNVTLDKRIRQKGRRWRRIKHLRLGDLPHALAVLRESYAFLEQQFWPLWRDKEMAVTVSGPGSDEPLIDEADVSTGD